MDEASAKAMADNGVWLSCQPFIDDGPVPPLAPANLLQNRRLVKDPARNFVLVMKSGRVYKNLLAT